MPSPNLRVVLAEQAFSETGLTLRALCAEEGWSLEMVFVGSRSDLGHALRTHCPDVAFLQLALLQPDAPGLLDVLHRSHPTVPFILFADPADTDCAVSCLSRGARDFMLEGFMDSRTMARTLRSAIGPPPSKRFASCAPGLNPLDADNTSDHLRAPAGDLLPRKSLHEITVTISIDELRSDAESFPLALLEFEPLLLSVIRSTDIVVPRRPGQWLVQFPGISERSVSRILQRLETHLASFRPSAPAPAHFELSIAVESSARQCEPALRTASPDLLSTAK